MMSVSIKSVEIKGDIPKSILQNISFEMDKGCVYTILGKNGSGKSTLISGLTKLLDENIYSVEAEIRFSGKNIYNLSTAELLRLRKEKIRYVFQDSVNSFDHLKKFDYYFKMLNTPEEEIANLFEYFLLPGKDKLLNLYPYEVSGGMAQRISISLAILTKPVLLILDEPTSAIDINISNLLCRKLREFVKDNSSSVLLITQDLDFAENVSDYMANMDKGILSKFYKTSEYKKNMSQN